MRTPTPFILAGSRDWPQSLQSTLRERRQGALHGGNQSRRGGGWPHRRGPAATGNAEPIREIFRSVPPTLYKEIHSLLKDMLKVLRKAVAPGQLLLCWCERNVELGGFV